MEERRNKHGAWLARVKNPTMKIAQGIAINHRPLKVGTYIKHKQNKGCLKTTRGD